MKKLCYFSLGSLLLIMLAGCGQKTMMQVNFDTYTFQRNTNGKTYTMTAAQPGAKLRYQAQQVTTGPANSLIISQMIIDTKTSLQDLVSLNTDQLAQKLLNYNGSKPSKSMINCRGARLTGYATNFSYDINTAQRFYIYQYYFTEGASLYLISFQADNSKDVSAIAKSIKSLVCK